MGFARGAVALKVDSEPYDFRARARESFGRQAAMRTIGAELTRVEQGTVEIELPFDAKLTQQHGLLHAGIISAALDAAGTYAAYSVIDPDASLLTIEFKVNLLSPGRGERFLFRGEVTKPGTTIIVSDGRAYAVKPDGPAKLIASMTGTMMVVRGREGIEG
ncbi:PaaI family thioesterase [Sinorhizobium alkalisoli]|uniref:Medium/long-chain acyl-CoA thioesterase YigI n=1 Tax=Sinorhizobium alkalisoli TaxID=1752398 RepID=A0A1E3V9S9_9HYPH|nr:PaaI family thioesterase [Sinorhizobium alkalisoli]MCA1490972.1 PaaI family thioesterase [Ensifer sp. NBAIM29]MCG5478612.1 PaaI family thioesterase [Sinorhizobium alkalisoli]ODR90319.1 phenylacetic acid degradation protein [Sinorhizobium alkalisoli]